MEAFSFKGKITQVNKLFVTFGGQFKSFYIEKHVLIDGINVQSNSEEDQFMLKESQEKGIILTHNGFQVQKIGQEKPKRAWIHKKDQEQYILALLFG